MRLLDKCLHMQYGLIFATIFYETINIEYNGSPSSECPFPPESQIGAIESESLYTYRTLFGKGVVSTIIETKS